MNANNRFLFRGSSVLLLAVGLIGMRPSLAALSYPGCTDLAASDFKQVTLVGRSGSVSATQLAVDATMIEPVGLYVKPDGKVFWAERSTVGNSGAQTAFGHVKMFDPTTNTVTQILNKAVASGVASGQNGNSELGLRFFTLHPNFAVNHWAYMYYMPRTSATTAGTDSMRVSRFTLNPTTYMVDTTSEKVILSMPWTPGICCHQGGGMDWDNHGNLFITTGNNTQNSTGFAPMRDAPADRSTGTPVGADKDMYTNSNQNRAANTMDFRGKLLRIHPDSSAKGYSIPAGNLRQVFYQIGGAWVANEDTNKILPEIYSFGTRNAYTVSVDTVLGWATIGAVGNDNTAWAPYSATQGGPTGADNWYINPRPAFNGWPYFVGRPRLASSGADSTASGMWDTVTNTYDLPPQKRDSVYNNGRFTTGIRHLPPAKPSAIVEYKQNSWNNGIFAALWGAGTGTGSMATDGPIYHYNAYPNNSKKWPPQLDGRWIVAESAKSPNHIYAALPNSGGDSVTDMQVIPGDGTVFTPNNTGYVDMKFGPEGALYIAYYNSGFFSSSATTKIARVEYVGNCSVGVVPILSAEQKKTQLLSGILYSSIGGMLVWPEGMRTAEVYDLQGKRVWTSERMASEASTQLPSNLSSGILRVRFKP